MFKRSEREWREKRTEQQRLDANLEPESLVLALSHSQTSCRGHLKMLLNSGQLEKSFWKSVSTHLHSSDETGCHTRAEKETFFFLNVLSKYYCSRSDLDWWAANPPLRHPAGLTSLWPSVTCIIAQCRGEICLLGNEIISETLIWGPGMQRDLWALTYGAGMDRRTRNDAFLQKGGLILLH